MYSNYTLHRVFIAPSTALSHKKRASAGISRESCCAQGYATAGLSQSFLRALHLLSVEGMGSPPHTELPDIYAAVSMAGIGTDI
jgi:hypothetical protein